MTETLLDEFFKDLSKEESSFSPSAEVLLLA